MLNEKLLSLDYYFNKLSMFMSNSYGVKEQFAIIHNILVSVDSTIDTFFENFNIMSQDITNVIAPGSNESDVLDKIASIYGVARQFSVSYTDGETQYTDVELNLNNFELLMLIRATIIQNNYSGTYEETIDFYKLIGLTGLITLLNAQDLAECDVYLTPSNIITENISKMFLAGLLTLKSLGIKYNHTYIDINNIGVWDVSEWDDSTRVWS